MPRDFWPLAISFSRTHYGPLSYRLKQFWFWLSFRWVIRTLWNFSCVLDTGELLRTKNPLKWGHRGVRVSWCLRHRKSLFLKIFIQTFKETASQKQMTILILHFKVCLKWIYLISCIYHFVLLPGVHDRVLDEDKTYCHTLRTSFKKTIFIK